jgi:hypothetical protein
MDSLGEAKSHLILVHISRKGHVAWGPIVIIRIKFNKILMVFQPAKKIIVVQDLKKYKIAFDRIFCSFRDSIIA